MYGISSASKEAINKVVGNLFDKASAQLVGGIPKIRQNRISFLEFLGGTTLATLFIQAMSDRRLNNIEEDVLKGILDGAYGYVQALKEKTTNAVSNEIEGIARNARIKNEKISKQQIDEVVKKEMDKAKSVLKAIVAAEATKSRNLGATMDITRKAAENKEPDPLVAFAVIRDSSTCPICIELNLMPDGATPRVYRLSELNAGYYKRGDSVPSLLGNHPHCRCTPIMIPKGYGFDAKGKLTFISLNHDELENQKE